MNCLNNIIKLLDIYLKEVQSFFDIIHAHKTINLTGEISNTFHRSTIVFYLQAVIKNLTNRLQGSYVPLSSFFLYFHSPILSVMLIFQKLLIFSTSILSVLILNLNILKNIFE